MGRRARSVVRMDGLEDRRLLSGHNGTLDPAFGTGGVTKAHYRQAQDSIATIVTAGGKVIVVGDTDSGSGGNKDIVVARFNSNGSVDSSFGNGGSVFLDLGKDELATAVKLDAQQRIVFGGVSADSSGLQSDIVVGRLNTDGSWDTSFNGLGYRKFDLGGLDTVSGLAISPTSGDIFLGGSSTKLIGGGVAVMAVMPNGKLDGSFGTGGWQINPSATGTVDIGTGLAWTPWGLYVPGFSLNATTQHSQMLLEKFSLGGMPDSTFGMGGKVMTSFGGSVDLATAIAVNYAARIVYIAGTTANGTVNLSPGTFAGPKGLGATSADFAVSAFTAGGQLVPTFATNGHYVHDFRGGLDGASGIGVDSQGGLVIGGGSELLSTGKSNFASLHLSMDGLLDTGYGDNGEGYDDLGGSDGAFEVQIGPNGELYLCGHSKQDSDNYLVILRYLSDFGVEIPVYVCDDETGLDLDGEGGDISFLFGLSEFGAFPIDLHYQTVDGTGTAGVNYDAVGGDLTFMPGQVQQRVNVHYHGVLPPGESRDFLLDLVNGSGATAGETQVRGTIAAPAVNPNAVGISAVTPSKVPVRLIGGSKTAKGSEIITLMNRSQSVLKGKGLLSVYGSSDDVLSPSTDVLLGKLNASLNLKPGASKMFSVPVTFGKVSVTSDLNLIVAATGAGVTVPGLASLDGAVVTVEAPTVDLVGSGTPAPISVKLGAKFSALFSVVNVGNADAAGALDFDVHITTDGTDATERFYYFTKTAKASLLSNKPAKISLTFSTALAQFPAAGNYILTFTLKTSRLNAANTTDGTVLVTIPFTVH